MTAPHKERAHSKFSASGAERWLNCAASVALEEASPPSKDNFWSREGTLAHECLEANLNRKPYPLDFDVTSTMIHHVEKAADKIRAILRACGPGSVLLVEKRVFASFIHPEMFGTCDVIIAGAEGTLHIIDFKYGANHIVEPFENKQLIQYALSAGESYDWKFDFVKMWVMQPRAGKNWAPSWFIPMHELPGNWLPLWKKGVERVEKNTAKPFAGSWCHWCRAKTTCPVKNENRVNKISNVFENNPLTKRGKWWGQKRKQRKKW